MLRCWNRKSNSRASVWNLTVFTASFGRTGRKTSGNLRTGCCSEIPAALSHDRWPFPTYKTYPSYICNYAKENSSIQSTAASDGCGTCLRNKRLLERHVYTPPTHTSDAPKTRSSCQSSPCGQTIDVSQLPPLNPTFRLTRASQHLTSGYSLAPLLINI